MIEWTALRWKISVCQKTPKAKWKTCPNLEGIFSTHKLQIIITLCILKMPSSWQEKDKQCNGYFTEQEIWKANKCIVYGRYFYNQGNVN